jgi:hypothetical protein
VIWHRLKFCEQACDNFRRFALAFNTRIASNKATLDLADMNLKIHARNLIWNPVLSVRQDRRQHYVNQDFLTGPLLLRAPGVGFAPRFAVGTFRFAPACVSDNASWSR